MLICVLTGLLLCVLAILLAAFLLASTPSWLFVVAGILAVFAVVASVVILACRLNKRSRDAVQPEQRSVSSSAEQPSTSSSSSAAAPMWKARDEEEGKDDAMLHGSESNTSLATMASETSVEALEALYFGGSDPPPLFLGPPAIPGFSIWPQRPGGVPGTWWEPTTTPWPQQRDNN
jgi:hypothetical protein